MTIAPFFSIVVTAPRGIGHCDYLHDWQPELKAHRAELIIADGTEGVDENDEGMVRHRRFPGASFQQLLSHGVAAARGDWVLITEDHCRPLDGLLASYARAIGENPGAELIAGVVDNLTSVAPWSWTIFAIGLGRFWREAPQPSSDATNANFLILRSAIRTEELTTRGGILNRTIPRLVKKGSFTTCSDAAVDHIVHLTRQTAVAFEYGCTREWIDEARSISGPYAGIPANLLLSLKTFYNCSIISPLEAVVKTRGTPLATWANRLRIFYVCIAVAARLLCDDLTRIIRTRAASRAVA